MGKKGEWGVVGKLILIFLHRKESLEQFSLYCWVPSSLYPEVLPMLEVLVLLVYSFFIKVSTAMCKQKFSSLKVFSLLSYF